MSIRYTRNSAWICAAATIIEPTLTFVTPEIYIAWQHDYLNSVIPIKSRLASGAGDVFTVNGPALGHDSLIINPGLTVQWTPTVSTCLRCTVQAAMQSSGYDATDVNAGVRVAF